MVAFVTVRVLVKAMDGHKRLFTRLAICLFTYTARLMWNLEGPALFTINQEFDNVSYYILVQQVHDVIRYCVFMCLCVYVFFLVRLYFSYRVVIMSSTSSESYNSSE